MWELQNIIVYLIVLAALVFVEKKLFLKIISYNSAGCETGCGSCH